MDSSSQPSIISISENNHEFHGAAPIGDGYTTHLMEYRIPGFLVNPTKLVEVLRARFENNYRVKLRNDNYSICVPRKLTKAELIMCY
ncbi:hypothetical protein F4805DRAFT_425754 [Annulohypoxylon moriforme]|nr:hypothetical protein F4805DRAFT_425754 [Annulohypoxylon moriforme]